MIPRDVKSPTAPIPFHKLLKVVAIVDPHDEQSFPELAMSPKEAYEALVANDVDYVPLETIKGRISATLALIYPSGIGVVVPGERWDGRAQPMLDYFLAFQESFNRFPGFNYEVQGVFQERLDGRIKFHTYVVRE
jgi:ornithine decarboxylase